MVDTLTIDLGKLSRLEIGNGDVVIEVKENGQKTGDVLISKGAIEWFPAGNSRNKLRLNWSEFAKVMREHGKRARTP